MSFTAANSAQVYLPNTVVYSEDESQFLIQLTNQYTRIADAINLKEIGQYETVELLNGQQFFNIPTPQNKRFGFRLLFSIGAIATGATLTFAHGITGFSILTFTDIYGTIVTDAATFNKRPLPYVSATVVTNQVQLDVDDTNVRIVNGATAPNITSGIVVLEYLKN